LEEQRLVGFLVESAAPSVGAFFAEFGVKTPAQEIALAPPAAHGFNEAQLAEVLQPGFESIWHRMLALDAVEDEKIVRGEGREGFFADFFEEADEGRIAYRAVQGQEAESHCNLCSMTGNDLLV
jgi:hypothetical protein